MSTTQSTTPDKQLKLRVQAIRYHAQGVRSYELRSPHGADLPEFTAGSHIDLALKNGLVRSYSLANSSGERHRYVIGVQRDPASRGGSTYIHDELAVGDLIEVSAPCNNFELVKDASPSVLVAGGIGITPLLSMARSLTADRRPWQLHYAVRGRDQLAFVDDLLELETEAGSDASVSFHVDAEVGGVLDIRSIVDRAPEGAQFYCCGPTPMLDGFAVATASIPESHRHVEHFTNDEAPNTDGGFEVELATTGTVVEVQAGETILDAVKAVGVDVDYSCMEGVCGTCETRVLQGVPDHRDQVLTDREKAANDVMMICCSGSTGSRLVLEL